MNGRVGIRTAATGASVSGRLKIGTPLALSTIGEMNVQARTHARTHVHAHIHAERVQIDFSAVAQPCDVSDVTLELGATLQVCASLIHHSRTIRRCTYLYIYVYMSMYLCISLHKCLYTCSYTAIHAPVHVLCAVR